MRQQISGLFGSSLSTDVSHPMADFFLFHEFVHMIKHELQKRTTEGEVSTRKIYNSAECFKLARSNETYFICKGEHGLQNMKIRRINPRKFSRKTREIFARQRGKYSKSWWLSDKNRRVKPDFITPNDGRFLVCISRICTEDWTWLQYT